MKKPSFLNSDHPLLTTMVQARTPDRIKELIDLSVPEGAEAFGMQFCRLDSEYRNRAVYEELFDYADDKPVYVNNGFLKHFQNAKYYQTCIDKPLFVFEQIRGRSFPVGVVLPIRTSEAFDKEA